jgi:acetyltransferase
MLSSKYVREVWLKSGVRVLIRPIQPEDARMEREFIERLGPESDYNRFFSYYRNPSPEMIKSLCNIDYETQMALVAEMPKVKEPKLKMIIGVGRIIQTTKEKAEIAIVVADEYQHQGLGTKLTEMLLEFAQDKRFTSVYGIILPENDKMIGLAKKFGFKIRKDQGAGLDIAELSIANNRAISSQLLAFNCSLRYTSEDLRGN